MKTIIIGVCVLGCYGCIVAAGIIYGFKAAALAALVLLLMGVLEGVI